MLGTGTTPNRFPAWTLDLPWPCASHSSRRAGAGHRKIVATKWPNGSIHTNPAWFEYEDGYFRLNSINRKIERLIDRRSRKEAYI
jgi:hypothetical protein